VAFAGDAETWIRRFKYPAAGLAGLDPAPAAVLREIVRAAAARSAGAPPDAVIPVPLHVRRLRRRGFNPAALLAREVARAAGTRLDCGTLQRWRDTPSQTGLDRAGRRRNVAGAFCARSAPARVWLVDDVITTGSTLGEAARALRRAGAHEVVGVCAARTL
jgi:ComF family protein